MKPELLNQPFRLADQLFKCGVRAVFRGILHHFHFIELMPADHAPFLRTVASRFPAIAGRIGDIFPRQLRHIQDFSPMEIDEGRLGGGEHELLFTARRIFNPIYLIHELRELPRHVSAVVSQHMRGQDKFVPVGNVFLDEEIEDRPFQTGAPAPVNPAAGQLGAPFIVDQSQAFTELHMVFRLKIENRLFSERMQDAVFLFSSGSKIVVRQIRQGEKQGLLLVLEFRQRRIPYFDFGRKLFHPGHQGGGIAALLFDLGDFFGIGVLLGFHSLHFACELAAAHVDIQDFIHHGVEVHVPFAYPGLDQIGISAYQFDVQHVDVSISL